MLIFGLTPIDAALSVTGLNFAQVITQFLFKDTAIGIIFGVAGYLILIFKLSTKGEYRKIYLYTGYVIILILLLFPSHVLTTFTSAQDNSQQETQSLKESFTRAQSVPVVYTFISQGFDVISIGIIKKIDEILPQWAKFSIAPYESLRLPLYIREKIRLGIQDQALKKRLEKFIHLQYLPALARIKHDNPGVSFFELSPQDRRIQNVYTSKELRDFKDIERGCYAYFDQDEHLNGEARQRLGLLSNVSQEVIAQQLFRSFVTSMVLSKNLDKKEHVFKSLSFVLNIVPVIHGTANMVLAMLFPFLLLMFFINTKASSMFIYLKHFLWVKFWPIAIAISFYVSMFALRLQSMHITGIAWVWEYPYFCVVFVILLFSTIVLTRKLIV